MASQKPLTHDVLAYRFLNESDEEPRINFLRFCDAVFVYKEGIYEPVDFGETLIPGLFQFFTKMREDTNSGFPPTQNITISMMTDIGKIVLLIIPRKIQSIESTFIAFNDNNLLNLSTSPFSIEPWDRKNIAFLKLDFSSEIMDPNINNLKDFKETRFHQFLNEVLIDAETKESDQELINLVQEMFGYALLDNNKAETAFFLYGSGANGKSVLLAILRSLFPPHLVSSSSLESLTTNRFRLASLVGKKINIVNEEESKYLKSDVFKNLVTGEPITCERKFEKEFEVVPIIKLIFATNSIPSFDGVDKAIRRRIKIIPFNASFEGQARNPHLIDELKAENPSILLWALEGAKRLIDNNYVFSKSSLANESMGEFESSQSSAIEFFVESYEITSNPDDMLKKADIYKDYRDWTLQAGRTGIKSKMVFFTDIKRRFEEEGLSFPKYSVWSPKDNATIRAVCGLKITSDQTAWINDKK